MGEPMLTKEQADKLIELHNNVLTATIKLVAGPNGTVLVRRLVQIKAEEALNQYIKELTNVEQREASDSIK